MFQAAFWAVAAATMVNAVELTKPAPGTEIIAGRYIATVRANMTDDAHAALATKLGMKKHKIGSTFRAVSGSLADVALTELLNHNDVLTVEHDAIMHALQTCTASQSEPVSWGQVRTTTYQAGGSQTFAHNPSWGANVDVYVLDTGIRCTHSEFTGGRCMFGANFAGGADGDANGHGTHCAGTIGGQVYGLAKSATVIAVKVLSDAGSGTIAGIVEGCEFASSNAAARGNPSVMSFSLGGLFNQAMDNAVDAMVTAGGHVAVASGNSNIGACNFSPARAALPITVSATELGNSGGMNVDAKASYSNWGQCVDVWAPGSAITSAGVANDNAYATFSGTSMACPHVAGALAIYLSTNPNATPTQSKAHITTGATHGVIQGITEDGSPNLMLHVQC